MRTNEKAPTKCWRFRKKNRHDQNLLIASLIICNNRFHAEGIGLLSAHLLPCQSAQVDPCLCCPDIDIPTLPLLPSYHNVTSKHENCNHAILNIHPITCFVEEEKNMLANSLLSFNSFDHFPCNPHGLRRC